MIQESLWKAEVFCASSYLSPQTVGKECPSSLLPLPSHTYLGQGGSVFLSVSLDINFPSLGSSFFICKVGFMVAELSRWLVRIE